MKTNKMMRLASLLLVLTLLSTCAISGTFAKYVTSDTASDKAQVAKFGVTVTAWDNSMFATSYAKDDDKVTDKNITNSVAVATGVNYSLVAPGTKNTGDGTTFSITGTPEVAVNVKIALEITNDVFLNKGTYADWTTGDNTDSYNVTEAYYPVVFTLKQGTTQVAQGNLTKIKEYLTSISKNFEPNKDLSTEFGTYTLTWAWAFEDSDNSKKEDVNKKDTTLGNLAAGNAYTTPNYSGTGTVLTPQSVNGASTTDDGKYNLNIEYKITITVTQID